MGFHAATTGPSTTWAKFAEGKIVLSSKEPRAGYVSRVNKNGNTVYEEHHDAFTGVLQSVEISESEYGKQFVFRFFDGKGYYNITAGYSSRYAKTMISALASPAVDLQDQVTLVPYSFKNDKDKTVTGVTLMQRAVKVPPAYSRETLPPLREVKIKGQIQYDDTEIMDFLEARVNDTIRPRLGLGATVRHDAADALEATVQHTFHAVSDDGDTPDLPF
jgi:hypothetical protein